MSLATVSEASSRAAQGGAGRPAFDPLFRSRPQDGGGRTPAKALSQHRHRTLVKLDRKHQAWQLRRQRREAVLEGKRNLGRKDEPPHLVVLVPLHARVVARRALESFQSDGASIVWHTKGGAPGFGLLCPQFKRWWRFVVADTGNIHTVLNLAKVADTLLFLLDPTEGWDVAGKHRVSCIFAQGLPSYGLAVQGLSGLLPKKQCECREKLRIAMEKSFPGARLFALDTEEESALLLRHLAGQKQRRLAFRDRRPHLMAEVVQFACGPESFSAGTLKVSGYLRGQRLSVNAMVHILGHGDFLMSQMDAPTEPFAPTPRVPKGPPRSMEDQDALVDGAAEVEEQVRVLSKQEPLQSEAVPDPTKGEQAWPTEEELKEAQDSLQRDEEIPRKVPKRTSAYQPAWIPDEEELWQDGSEEEEEEEEEDLMKQAYAQDESSSEGPSSEEEEAEEEEEKMEEEEMMEEEEAILEKFWQERQPQKDFDEVYSPPVVAARVRFRKYRALKSFVTSPWDPRENLPMEYARIFQFRDFSRSRKHVFRQMEKEEGEGAEVGWYVTLHICNVPLSVMESFQQGSPLVLFTLLPYEQKMSVLNLLVRRHPGYSEPVRSKEEVIIHCGFRRFRASPLFSQHSTGDKHKLEQFLPSDAAVVATIYGPITFPPASVLLFKQEKEGAHSLLATGSLLSVDPDRLVIKRIVLSGHPFKIHRKMAVVRYMFFNREDVTWFKPVELRTKWGRRGHIKEPLGTHGHMKCQFDGQLKSQDTVLMTLYKRAFPKWTYDPFVPEPRQRNPSSSPCNEEEGMA